MRKAILLILLCATSGFAQIETCTAYKNNIDQMVAGTDRAVQLMSIEAAPRCFLMYAAGETEDQLTRASFQELVRRFESSRSDKQSGGASGGGSTSIVAQGPVAKALSVAAEHGALTQSVSGQIITVRANLAGLPSALVRQNIFPYCAGEEATRGYCVKNSLVSALRRVSLGVSFDASRNGVSAVPAGTSPATVQPVHFTGRKREIAGFSARIELVNQRDTNSKAFREAWAAKVGQAMDSPALDLLNTAGQITDQIVTDADYVAWRTRSVARARAAGRDRARIVAALKESLRDLVAVLNTKTEFANLKEKAAEAVAAYDRFFLEQDDLIDGLAKKPVLAFEYTNSRPAGQAETHNFRFIWDLPLNAQTKVIANSAVDFYNKVPSGAAGSVKKFRDAQFGVQLDHGLGRNSLKSPATISLAGYYQYQNTPAVLEIDPANPIPGVTLTGLPATATTVFTETGSIFLAQAKLTLAPSTSATKIPISFTYSNRTELIDKPTWRAQVGLTYDFDSLFSALSGR